VSEWSVVIDALESADEYASLCVETRCLITECVVQLLSETSLCSKFFDVSAKVSRRQRVTVAGRGQGAGTARDRIVFWATPLWHSRSRRAPCLELAQSSPPLPRASPPALAAVGSFFLLRALRGCDAVPGARGQAPLLARLYVGARDSPVVLFTPDAALLSPLRTGCHRRMISSKT
jgi:hypothetical protein